MEDLPSGYPGTSTATTAARSAIRSRHMAGRGFVREVGLAAPFAAVVVVIDVVAAVAVQRCA